MRVLIEGTSNYLNMGDVAMLQVAVRRLRSNWPQARILTITSNPELLQVHCPGVEPLFESERDLWFHSPVAPKDALLEALQRRRRWPLLYGRMLMRGLKEDPLARELLQYFLRTLRGIDLFVIAGMGSFSSVFVPDVVKIMQTIPVVKAMGARVVAFGQGIGPIDESSILWDVAARTLPLLDFIALRECRSGPSLLGKLGVNSERVSVTGDEAIEMAYHEDTTGPVSNLLGVSLRVAEYSGTSLEDARRLGEIIGTCARALGADVVGVPTCFGTEESDLEALATMFPDQRTTPASVAETTPQTAVQTIGRTRVVVTGAYHAGVFALSQGIPVVGLTKSEYYRDKFLGLVAKFGPGCDVIDLTGGDVTARIHRSIRRFWENPRLHRDSLLNAAREQISASQRAWAELPVRFPDLNRCAAEPAGVGEGTAGHIQTWYRFRVRRLEAELKKTMEYLHEVEAARDWHAGKAAHTEAELKKTMEYLHQVEAARDWHAGRTARTKPELKRQ
jgi:polysaccharide pyruvyl transferase WcaK-like protein